MITITAPSMGQNPNIQIEGTPISGRLITSQQKDEAAVLEGSVTYYVYTNEIRTVWFISNTDIFPTLLVENHLLRRAVRNLWKTHLYSQEYESFLLGNYSKKEFCEVARTYAEPLDDNVSEDWLRYAGGLFPEILGQSIDASDLSIMLNVDHKQISDVCALTRGQTYEIEGK